MLDLIGEPLALALIGGFGGVLLGLAARLGRFCSLGASEDALYGGDTRRLSMWGLAIGVAILGTYGAGAIGLADVTASAYLATTWNPWASIAGGLVFATLLTLILTPSLLMIQANVSRKIRERRERKSGGGDTATA